MGSGKVPFCAAATWCLSGAPPRLGDLRRDISRRGLRLLSEMPTARRGKRQGRRRNRRYLVEAVVGRYSPVVGMKCQSLDQIGEIGEALLARYGATMISVREDVAVAASVTSIFKNNREVSQTPRACFAGWE